MTNVIVVIAIILMLILAFYLWRFMMTRAIRTVVTLFRNGKAVTSESAVTLDSLGLEPLPLMRRLFRARDYKQQALHLLGQQGVIKMVEGPKFYLDESALRDSSLTRFLNEG